MVLVSLHVHLDTSVLTTTLVNSVTLIVANVTEVTITTVPNVVVILSYTTTNVSEHAHKDTMPMLPYKPVISVMPLVDLVLDHKSEIVILVTPHSSY
jgi:hypothetical protein